MTETHKKTALLRKMEKLLDKVRSSAAPKVQLSSEIDRRDFLRMGAIAGAAAVSGLTSAIPAASAADQAQASAVASAPTGLNEVTILELQAEMAAGHLTAVHLLNN